MCRIKKILSFKYGKFIYDYYIMYKVIGWNILVKYEIFFNEGYKDFCNDVFLLNCMIGLVFF